MSDHGRGARMRLPDAGYLRLSQIIGDKKANPPIYPLIPVGKSTWWKGVQTGRYPQPVKISERCTAWRAHEVFALIEAGDMAKDGA